MKLSIRYDLAFLNALLRFADNQVEINTNPDQSEPSPDQERQASESLVLLCDMIDVFVDKRVDQERRSLLGTEASQNCEARKRNP